MKDDINCKYNAKALDFDEITVEAVAKMIQGTEKAFNTARNSAQRSAVALMVLAVKYPADAVVLAQTLAECLGDGVKGVGMVRFLRDKAGFRLDAEGKLFVSVKNEEWIRANLEAAKAKMWWSYVPDKPFAGLNLAAELTRLMDKARKADEGKEKLESDEDKAKVKVDMGMVRLITALVGGAPVHSDDALALVQKLVPSAVIPFPEKVKDEASTDAHPELPAEKAQATG